MGRIIPDNRLRTAADLVRQGAYFADIGTDHAYLPVFLSEEGKIAGAYASDVAEGPVTRAREHVAAAGLSDRILVRRADGLEGLFDRFPSVTDIAVCGMGGELIVRLLSEEPRILSEKIRLILQPMSRPAALRLYLAETGFSVIEERLLLAQGRIYTCIAAQYTGVPYTLSYEEAEIGAYHLVSPPTPLFYRYIRERLLCEKEKIAGMKTGGRCTEKEEAFAAFLENIMKREKTYDGE